MRKILFTYVPASVVLAFLAMVLLTCGGGGSGGTLTGLSISGPATMSEYETATYKATATWDGNSTTTVTPTWSVDSQMATISNDGCLLCQEGIDNDQVVTITATYSAWGITKTATLDVTINHVPIVPFTDEELRGKVFYDIGSFKSLYKLNTDSSLEVYFRLYGTSGDRGYCKTGTWNNNPDRLFLEFADTGEYTVYRTADSSTDMEVIICETFWGSHVSTWEKTIPVEPAKLPGTYKDDIDGTTWVFNANGTGTVSVFGGTPFTWSVDTNGVLRMLASNGYAMSFYVRATSQSNATEYTILKAAFIENSPGGGFYGYYGGIELTRQ